jgi:pSer/pThr/pTyr-binding forkhead associated (FHA) protein
MLKNTLNLPELIYIAVHEGRDAFLAASPYPVLIPRAVTIGDLEHGDKTDDTMQHIPAVADDVSMFETPRVLVLRKRSGLRGGQAVAIGRTPETDLVLSDHSVSKHHAAFHRVSGAHWELEDTGSKNGTWIDDLRLIPGVPVQIESKEELRFGRIHLRFFAPEDFYEQVVEIARKP